MNSNLQDLAAAVTLQGLYKLASSQAPKAPKLDFREPEPLDELGYHTDKLGDQANYYKTILGGLFQGSKKPPVSYEDKYPNPSKLRETAANLYSDKNTDILFGNADPRRQDFLLDNATKQHAAMSAGIEQYARDLNQFDFGNAGNAGGVEPVIDYLKDSALPFDGASPVASGGSLVEGFNTPSPRSVVGDLSYVGDIPDQGPNPIQRILQKLQGFGTQADGKLREMGVPGGLGTVGAGAGILAGGAGIYALAENARREREEQEKEEAYRIFLARSRGMA